MSENSPQIAPREFRGPQRTARPIAPQKGTMPTRPHPSRETTLATPPVIESTVRPERTGEKETQEKYVVNITDTILRAKQSEIAKETAGLDDNYENRDRDGKTEWDRKINELGVRSLNDFASLVDIKDGDFSAPDQYGNYAIDLTRHSDIPKAVEHTKPDGTTATGEIQQVLRVEGDIFTCRIKNTDGSFSEAPVSRGDVLVSFLTAEKDAILSQFTNPSQRALMEMYIDIAQNGVENAVTLANPDQANQTVQEAGKSIGMLAPDDELAFFDSQMAKLARHITTPGVAQMIQELRNQKELRRQQLSQEGELFLSPTQISERALITIEGALSQAQGELNDLRRRKASGEKIPDKAVHDAELIIQELKDQQGSVSQEGDFYKGIAAMQNGELPVEAGQRARTAYRTGDASAFAEAIIPSLKTDSAEAYSKHLSEERRKAYFGKGKKTALFASLGSAAVLLFLMKASLGDE